MFGIDQKTQAASEVDTFVAIHLRTEDDARYDVTQGAFDVAWAKTRRASEAFTWCALCEVFDE